MTVRMMITITACSRAGLRSAGTGPVLAPPFCSRTNLHYPKLCTYMYLLLSAHTLCPKFCTYFYTLCVKLCTCAYHFVCPTLHNIATPCVCSTLHIHTVHTCTQLHTHMISPYVLNSVHICLCNACCAYKCAFFHVWFHRYSKVQACSASKKGCDGAEKCGSMQFIAL